MTERAWVSTGHRQRVDNPSEIDRIPAYDPRSGEHCWLVITSYRVDPARFASPDPTVTPMLDQENLMSVVGPGCFFCEQPYTPLLASRRCRGDR